MIVSSLTQTIWLSPSQYKYPKFSINLNDFHLIFKYGLWKAFKDWYYFFVYVRIWRWVLLEWMLLRGAHQQGSLMVDGYNSMFINVICRLLMNNYYIRWKKDYKRMSKRICLSNCFIGTKCMKLSLEDQLIWIKMGYSGFLVRKFLKNGPTLFPYFHCSAKGGNEERRWESKAI